MELHDYTGKKLENEGIGKDPNPNYVDPVARSLAKSDAFMKPASFSKPGATNTSVRVRPMNWKRGRGRPRKFAPDKRKVHWF